MPDDLRPDDLVDIAAGVTEMRDTLEIIEEQLKTKGSVTLADLDEQLRQRRAKKSIERSTASGSFRRAQVTGRFGK